VSSGPVVLSPPLLHEWLGLGHLDDQRAARHGAESTLRL
jgi:hypothetical protein